MLRNIRIDQGLLIISLILFQSIFCQARTKRLINFDWNFAYNEQEGAEKINYDDSKWQKVQLPHDASIYGPFVQDTLGGNAVNGFRPRRIGWYRKYLDIDRDLQEKKVFIEFEGVYRAAKVWVNGEYCGQQLNGYLDFQFDITDKVKQGENVIAVRYDNTFKNSSRWYTGEGINRNVYLKTTEKVHVGQYGTYITTPKINSESAKVEIETDVINDIKDSISCKLVTDIISPDGKKVASRTSVVPLTEGRDFKFEQEIKISDPERWDINNPALYKAVTKVYKGKEKYDQYETNFGIRDVEFTPNKGFLLNGRKVFLEGVCLHHDLGPLGSASFKAGWKKRLKTLKNDLGVNAIRLSHNPYPKYVLEWCDKNGILVYDEAYDKWNHQFYGPGNAFKNYWRKDLKTFIKRDRNHPSVFIWSVGNEVGKQVNAQEEYGVTQLKNMVNYVHQLDPTRKVTCALFPARWNGVLYSDPNFGKTEPHQMAFYMDIMSVNYQGQFFARDHKKYPQLKFILSEATTGTGGYTYFRYDHSYTVGQFYWGGTEYIGESFGWPSKGWINGLITLTNNLKPVAYGIKSFYHEKPMVHIAIIDKSEQKEKTWNENRIFWQPMFSHWNWKNKDSLTIQTFSNCDQVELLINGKSLGNKAMANCDQQKMIWKAPYKEGTITALGKRNGKVLARHKLQTAGKAKKIILKSDRDTIKADGLDLAYIAAKVVDKNGIIVPHAEHKINFSVTGAGTNAGVGNGNILSNDLWQSDSRKAYQGRCQLIVRSRKKPGNLKITAHSEGLKSDMISIITRSP